MSCCEVEFYSNQAACLTLCQFSVALPGMLEGVDMREPESHEMFVILKRMIISILFSNPVVSYLKSVRDSGYDSSNPPFHGYRCPTTSVHVNFLTLLFSPSSRIPL